MSCAIRAQVVHTLRRAKTLRAPRYRGQRQFWSDMPAGASSILWFEELFGFREGSSYRENRAKFRMEGEVLCVDGAPKYKKHFVGRWSTPSLAELRAELGVVAQLGLLGGELQGDLDVGADHAGSMVTLRGAPQARATTFKISICVRCLASSSAPKDSTLFSSPAQFPAPST